MLTYERQNKLTRRIDQSISGTYKPQDIEHYYTQIIRIVTFVPEIEDIVREVKEISEAVITVTERPHKAMDQAPISANPVEGYNVLLYRIGLELYDVDDPPTAERWAVLTAARNRIEQSMREHLFGAHIDIANPDGRKGLSETLKFAIARLLDCGEDSTEFLTGARAVFSTFLKEYPELADSLGVGTLYGTCAIVTKGTTVALLEDDEDDFDLLEGAEWAVETIDDLIRDIGRTTWHTHIATRYDNGRDFLK